MRSGANVCRDGPLGRRLLAARPIEQRGGRRPARLRRGAVAAHQLLDAHLPRADEVQAGFGRSGTHFWAHQRYDLTPDIVTMGKPMGNGHPLAGVVARVDMIEAFSKEAMYFNTFGGTPVSCAVGMAVLDALQEDHLMENAVSTGAYVTAGLRKLQEKYPLIGDVRDLGMFFGVELVQNRTTKAPAIVESRRIINLMRERGVLISTIGVTGSILKLRPPMPFQPEHADLLISTLDDVLDIVSREMVG